MHVKINSARLGLALLIHFVLVHFQLLGKATSLMCEAHVLVYQDRPLGEKDVCCSMHYSYQGYGVPLMRMANPSILKLKMCLYIQDV